MPNYCQHDDALSSLVRDAAMASEKFGDDACEEYAQRLVCNNTTAHALCPQDGRYDKNTDHTVLNKYCQLKTY